MYKKELKMPKKFCHQSEKMYSKLSLLQCSNVKTEVICSQFKYIT